MSIIGLAHVVKGGCLNHAHDAKFADCVLDEIVNLRAVFAKDGDGVTLEIDIGLKGFLDCLLNLLNAGNALSDIHVEPLLLQNLLDCGQGTFNGFFGHLGIGGHE